MNKIVNPHDKFFKSVWSNKENARDFLLNYLPEDVLSHIDLNTLTVTKDSFIEKELKEYFSEILYSVSLDNSSGYIYLLFEHKSSPPKRASLQLLRYMVKIWELHVNQFPKEKLPIIIPLLIYHGKDEWSTGNRLTDIMSDPKKELSPYIPDFQFILYDLSDYSDEEIKGIVTLKISLLLFKYIFQTHLQEELKKIFSLFRELLDKETGLEFLETVIRYLFSTTSAVTEKELQAIIEKTLSKEMGGKVMTIAERLIEKGRKEGRKKGREKGREEGILLEKYETIEFGLLLRFGEAGLSLMPSIRNINNITQLDALKDAIKKATDIWDIQKVLKEIIQEK